MTKAIVNALTLALAEFEVEGSVIPLSHARDFAETFIADNAELFTVQVVTVKASVAGATRTATVDEAGGSIVGAIPMAGVSKGGLPVPALSQEELKAAQVAEYVAAGVRLCPNCQQPNTDHLPGCARATGEDPKSRTKNPLSPVG